MMFRRLITFCVAVLPAVATAAPGDAVKDAPHQIQPGPKAGPGVAGKLGPGTQAVKSANDTIAALLKQKAPPNSKEEAELATKVTTSVRGFLDIDELGKRAMVDNWPKLSKAQQDQFLALLRQLIEDSYVRGLRANVEYSTDYTGET